MSAPPYMRFYWGDYFANTRRLDRLEHSAYLLLLGEMWVQGGKLPLDDAELAKCALCTPDEWQAVKPAVMPFFRVVRGQLTQKRLAEEMAKYAVTVRKRKLAGKKGGLASRGKDSGNPQAIADQLPTKPEPEPEEERTPIVPAGDDGPGSPKIVLRQADIEQVWDITPPPARARTSRADIKAALQGAARRGHAPAAVIAGLVAYYATPEVAKEDYAFAKGAHRIITKDRWLDFASAAAPVAECTPEDPLDQHRRRVDRFKNGSRFWNTTDWGPQPGKPGCTVPPAVLAEFGFEDAQIIHFTDRSVA